MKLSLFDYQLPLELIAQQPSQPRDHSRLLIYNRKTKKIHHEHFYNLPKYLKPGDLLIFNNSKVDACRLFGTKPTGGKMEVFLLTQKTKQTWEAMIGGKGQIPGLKIDLGEGFYAVLVKRASDKTWLVKLPFSALKLRELIAKHGQVPLPPYIHSKLSQIKLKKIYQTVYAKKSGSAAAPTAGFHFTTRLLNKLKNQGIETHFVTLHVGLGTFMPVKTEKIEDHQMHSEDIEISTPTLKAIRRAKKENRRIICVGTTSLRALEAAADKILNPRVKSIAGPVNIFIYPGYKFKIITNLITNFHLPKSTLLMLVSAIIGRKKTLTLYHHAIKNKYRFFSFGDAMFIL